jgi:hypothetical protein
MRLAEQYDVAPAYRVLGYLSRFGAYGKPDPPVPGPQARAANAGSGAVERGPVSTRQASYAMAPANRRGAGR